MSYSTPEIESELQSAPLHRREPDVRHSIVESAASAEGASMTLSYGAATTEGIVETTPRKRPLRPQLLCWCCSEYTGAAARARDCK